MLQIVLSLLLSLTLSLAALHPKQMEVEIYFLPNYANVSCFVLFVYIFPSVVSSLLRHLILVGVDIAARSFACDSDTGKRGKGRWKKSLCPIVRVHLRRGFRHKIYFISASLALSAPPRETNCFFALLSDVPAVRGNVALAPSFCMLMCCLQSALRYTRSRFPVHKFIYCHHFFYLALKY